MKNVNNEMKMSQCDLVRDHTQDLIYSSYECLYVEHIQMYNIVNCRLRIFYH